MPFTVALGLLFGLLALELLFAVLGLSLVGDGPDLDIDGVEVPDVGDLPSMGVDVDLPELAEYDIPDMAETDADTVEASGGLSTVLGLGKVPFMIWLASLLMGFGLTGVIAQLTAINVLGFALPVGLVATGAIVVAIWFTRQFSQTFARLLPKTETTSLSTRRYGGHKGVVTQGVARRGHPAEVRIVDRFGNFHYLRAEPIEDDGRIKAGTEVVILRNMRTGVMRLLPLS